MSAVRSFDVFDTVLTRRVGRPEAVVDLLAERLEQAGEISTTAAAFSAARQRQERRLNRLTASHVTLREIHAEIAATLGATPEAAARWAAAEEQLERELTIPVPGVAATLNAAREAGEQVVFVSDTPHSEALVAELLTRHGLAQPTDRVFTSSARGASKSQGGLFHAVAVVLGSDRHYVHTGDNAKSDVASPRSEGWEGRLAPHARLNRYERLLETHAPATHLTTSWLAGSSRRARLEALERGVAAPLADVAAGAMAPMLVAYATWVTAQARLRGIERLYFVARDGEIMLEVARHVIGRLAPDIELRYLHGSRQPWVLGACATSDTLLAHWALGRTDFTARTTLARLSLTPDQAHDLTGLPMTRPDRADTPLSAEERAELARHLQQDPLVSVVRRSAASAAARVTAYLQQEGVTDGTPSALVDAGWSGRAAAALDQLLVAAGGAPTTHFFVGLLGTAAEADLREGVDLVPWLFDKQRHTRALSELHSPNVLVEMLCAGTTGRTVDYAVDATTGHVTPVLDKERNEPALAWGLAEVQRTAVRVAELVAPCLPPDAASTDSTGYAWDVLRAFWTEPTAAEVGAWGSFPGEEEIWPPFAPVAEQITARGMLERVRRGEKSLRRNDTWRAGTALASSQPWRGMLRARAWQQENQDRIRRIPRRLRLEVATRRKR